MSLAFLSEPTSAEPPYLATCGAVRAFTAPSAGVSGSVTIGTATFALHAPDRLPAATSVGNAVCINRTVTTAGPVLELIAMPSPICGEVLGVSKAIPAQRAEVLDIVTTTPGLRIALAASPNLGFTFPQRATLACFGIRIDASGTAIATTVSGAVVPVRTPTAPLTPTLPSTATDANSARVVAVVAAALAAVAFLLKRRRRASTAR
jgi:LPXTG-motif cell wall-anchored protein